MSKSFASFLFLLGLLASCANPVAPTGGDKDTEAPFLTYAEPDTFATQVNQTSIRMGFNEWVELQNPSREILISPPQKNAPEVKIKGKGIELILKDSLIPNTTYIIQFGNAIVDFTEANPASGLSYVFSTGPELDSGYIEMLLLDAYTKAPIAKAALLAFKSGADSLPYKEKPDFVAFSNEKGIARLPYLADLKLFLYGLKEPATDYLYRPGGGEQIGFFPEAVPSLPGYKDTLLLFFETPENTQISNQSEAYPGKVFLKFNKAIEQLEFRCVPDSLNQAARWEWGNPQKDSLVFWLGGPNYPDSLVFYIKANDLNDTLVYFPPPLPPGRGKRSNSDSPYLFKGEKPQGKVLYDAPLGISFNHGLSSLDTSKVSLLIDSTSIPFSYSFNGSKLLLDYAAKPNSNYALVWKDSAITDVYGLKISADSLAWSTLSERDFVRLEVRITGLPDNGPWMLEAIPEKKDALPIPLDLTPFGVRAEADSLGLEWNAARKLQAGAYQLRLIKDQNNNQIWDSGTLIPKQLPEPVYYSGSTVTLKGGFDQIQRWDLQGRDKPRLQEGTGRGNKEAPKE